MKSYPAELSLTALICIMGTIQGIILTITVEKENMAIWAIHPDTKFLASLYGVRLPFSIHIKKLNLDDSIHRGFKFNYAENYFYKPISGSPVIKFISNFTKFSTIYEINGGEGVPFWIVP